MNALKHRFTLEMTVLHSQATIHIKKYDTKNKLIISLSEHGKPYEISQNVRAVFVGKKPDGKIVFNDCVTIGNTIEYTITAQTSVTVGIVGCEIRLYDDNKNLLTSPRFTVVVDEIVYDENEVEIESENEFNVFVELLSETKALLEANERGELNGKDGATFTPHVSDDGVLSWSNDNGLENPDDFDMMKLAKRAAINVGAMQKVDSTGDVHLELQKKYEIFNGYLPTFIVETPSGTFEVVTDGYEKTHNYSLEVVGVEVYSETQVHVVYYKDGQRRVTTPVECFDAETNYGNVRVSCYISYHKDTEVYEPRKEVAATVEATVEQTESGAVITITDKNGTTTATVENGVDGADGTDGHTPVVTATKSNGVTSLKVDGVEIAQIADGKDGAAGATGESGYTPQKGVDYFDGEDGADGISVIHSWDGTTLTVTSASGTSSANLKGDPGERGPQGAPYTLTDMDKAAIVAEVLANFTDASEVAL